MLTTDRKRPGRKAVPDAQRKKSRGFSVTDAEWQELVRQALANSLEPSRYIIWKLQLSQNSTAA